MATTREFQKGDRVRFADRVVKANYRAITTNTRGTVTSPQHAVRWNRAVWFGTRKKDRTVVCVRIDGKKHTDTWHASHLVLVRSGSEAQR